MAAAAAALAHLRLKQVRILSRPRCEKVAGTAEREREGRVVSRDKTPALISRTLRPIVDGWATRALF